MEHAVIVHLPLSEEGMGSPDEQENAFALAEEFEAAISSTSVGEYDGEEFGGGRCVFYMYGPDADRLFAVVEPILRANPMARGGLAIKRYGEAADPDAAEVKVNL